MRKEERERKGEGTQRKGGMGEWRRLGSSRGRGRWEGQMWGSKWEGNSEFKEDMGVRGGGRAGKEKIEGEAGRK